MLRHSFTCALSLSVAAGCSGASTPLESASSTSPPGEGRAGAEAPPATVAVDATHQASDGTAPVTAPAPEGAAPAWLGKPNEPYLPGEVLKYLPKDCRERVYIDAGGLVGANAPDVKKVLEQVLAAKGDDREKDRVEKVIRTIREAGADPVEHWREIAVCRGDHEVAAIGLATKTPVEVPILVQKIKVGLGDGPGKVTRRGDLSMLVAPDGEVFAQPGPQVFVVSKDRDSLLAAIEAKSGAAGFSPALGQLVYVKTDKADMTLAEKAKNLEGRLTVHLRGQEGESAKKNAQAMKSKITEKLQSVADRLKSSPLKPVGERLRAVKITVQGTDVVFSGSIERSVLEAIVKGVSPADIEKLARAVD